MENEKKLEVLRLAMLKAREDYDAFIKANSRELTDIEKIELPETPMFEGAFAIHEEPRIVEITINNVKEFKRLEQNRRDTYELFVNEIKRQNDRAQHYEYPNGF